MDIKVETIKFNTPLQQEHKRQLKKKLDQWCRHRKVEYIDKIIPEMDQVITIKCCSECGKAL